MKIRQTNLHAEKKRADRKIIRKFEFRKTTFTKKKIYICIYFQTHDKFSTIRKFSVKSYIRGMSQNISEAIPVIDRPSERQTENTNKT